MKDILLDTNIVIYALNGDLRIVTWLTKFSETKFHISIITWIEILSGSFRHGKTIDEISQQLECFCKLPLGDNVAQKGATLMQEQLQLGKKRPFQDCLIAATAVIYRMPLFTNNPRDFRNFKDIKIVSMKK